MQVFIVQGFHPHIPGVPMTAHATKPLAIREAIDLANIILEDSDLPAIATDENDPLAEQKITDALAVLAEDYDDVGVDIIELTVAEA